MKKNINSKDGFTIIEVLIVLAIAGLIMAVVLLAVPGLQRSQANTAARTDASHIATAVTSWSANNNGSIPTNGGTAAELNNLYDIYQNVGSLSKFTDTNASSTAQSTGSSSGNEWQINNPGSGSYGGWYLGAGDTNVAQIAQSSPSVWAVFIDTGVTCATNPESGATVSLNTGNSDNIAILYTTETSGKPDWNCLQGQ